MTRIQMVATGSGGSTDDDNDILSLTSIISVTWCRSKSGRSWPKCCIRGRWHAWRRFRKHWQRIRLKCFVGHNYWCSCRCSESAVEAMQLPGVAWGSGYSTTSDIRKERLAKVDDLTTPYVKAEFSNNNFMFDNSEMNHKDHMNWLVESGACQLDEIEMPPPLLITVFRGQSSK